jgi:hypothetical protein
MKAASRTGIVLPDGSRVKAASHHCLLPSSDVREPEGMAPPDD